MPESLVEFRGLSKAFGGTQALDGVSFAISRGEVQALVGENGAGKSTLVKILGGVYRSNSGSILFDGQEVSFRNTHHSQRVGISVIYQEFNLLPALSVAENIFVGREPKKFGLLDWKEMRRRAERILAELDVSLDPRRLVAELSVAQKQMVEIAKALSIQARLIIMDEPTAALSERETEKLFEIVRTLQRQGKTILFVSHRLQEIFAICERVTVLRDGRFVATRQIEELEERDIVRLMVGRDIDGFFTKDAAYTENKALSARGLFVGDVLRDITFDARKGEIVALAGLMGSGRTELMEVLYGVLPLSKGAIFLDGRQTTINSPRTAIALGIGFLTEERKTDGVFPRLSVLHNVTMTILKRLTRLWGAFIDIPAEKRHLSNYTSRFGIRYAGAGQSIEYLSGGNQQKTLLARALSADCRLLLLCEPTRGVDVGAKAEIHALMNELAHKGVTIIMSSSDLPEVITMSDSCLVMREGAVAAHLGKQDMTETNIIGYATGQMAPVNGD